MIQGIVRNCHTEQWEKTFYAYRSACLAVWADTHAFVYLCV